MRIAVPSRTRLTCRGSFLAALLLPAAFWFSACSGGRDQTFPEPERAVDEGEYFAERATITTPEDDFPADFITLIVSERRDRPEARLLELRMIRVPATGAATKNPIVYLSSSPGKSNLAFQPPSALFADRDILLIGYRGVDTRNSFRCPDLDRAVFGQKDGMGSRTVDSLAAAASRCAGALAAAGVDLEGYTIEEMAADVESARLALGYEKLDIISEGVGSLIATRYAQRYVATAGRLVLLGSAAPGQLVPPHGAVDSVLARYAASWQEGRPTDAPQRELGQIIQSVYADWTEHWLIFRIDPGKTRLTASHMLPYRESAAMVFDAYVAASEGDASGLALMTQAYDMLVPTSAIWAAELALLANEQTDGSGDASARSVLSPPLGRMLYQGMLASSWPRRPAPPRDSTAIASDVLALTGEFDYNASMAALTRFLRPIAPGAAVRLLPNLGHPTDMWNSAPSKFSGALLGFLDSGHIPEQIVPASAVQFDVGLGFPRAAKLTIAMLLLVVLLLVGFFVFLAKLFRHHGALG